jgi:hypothetical protein
LPTLHTARSAKEATRTATAWTSSETSTHLAVLLPLLQRTQGERGPRRQGVNAAEVTGRRNRLTVAENGHGMASWNTDEVDAARTDAGAMSTS